MSAPAPALIVIAATPRAGKSEERPSSGYLGQSYFDTTLGKPLWWNGEAWALWNGEAAP